MEKTWKHTSLKPFLGLILINLLCKGDFQIAENFFRIYKKQCSLASSGGLREGDSNFPAPPGIGGKHISQKFGLVGLRTFLGGSLSAKRPLNNMGFQLVKASIMQKIFARHFLRRIL
jgi:hypothetical protein